MILLLLAGTSTAHAAGEGKVNILQTPAGVRFGLLGNKGSTPAPTLFVLGSSIEATLGDATYNKVGQVLGKEGYLSVSLDLPCHGKNVKDKEKPGLDGWAERLTNGEDFVAGFTAECSAVLDHLIKEGYTDPQRVAACGTSRGGFMALHFAAAEPRVKCVAAFAPVTDLLVLREFARLSDNAATKKVNLTTRTKQLTGRPVWICIGNNDKRVSTDEVIGFTRKLVEAAGAMNVVPVELQVMPTVGHTIHASAHDEVAAWVRSQIKTK
jgi:dienelactone hydrolase